MVVDTKLVSDFKDVDEFVKKLLPYSVFTEEDLRGFYSNNRRNNMVAIKMLYNVALPKRPIRKKLIEENVISEDERPTFLKLDKDKLNKLLAIGEVYEGIVIN
jgi:hypothetical protein